MQEIYRLYKKTVKVVISRGIRGFFNAGVGYLFKNFKILSFFKKKTGDILFVGGRKSSYQEKMIELTSKGYLCRHISMDHFDKKYIDLYDVICLGSASDISINLNDRVGKYNKLLCSLDDVSGNVDKFIKENRKKKIVYVSPSTNISGGLMVIAQHLQVLQKSGYNVALVSQDINIDMSWIKDFDIPVLHISEFSQKKKINDIAVATFWDTVSFVGNITTQKKYYLVQNKEHLFYNEADPFYDKAQISYESASLSFLTVSKWCQEWLLSEFDKNAVYISNCLDVELFNENVVALEEKVNKSRILIEGNPENDYKNIDEAFKIINKLNRKDLEVWLVSYGGKPKKWYKYDRLFNRVPYYDMPKIYRSCDILLKTSKLESFSYPPLEMMACGGMCVVAENEGNKEYVKDGYNALTYKIGNISNAVNCIKKIISNAELRKKLKIGAELTVRSRDLAYLEEELYKVFD
jgi:glycosyltransferase involved in cell wall biosynthesis